MSFRGAVINSIQNQAINGPWYHDGNSEIYDDSGIPVASMSNKAQIQLATSAPELLDALHGLVGLLALLRLRGDLPIEVAYALASSYRVREAIAAIAKAENRGESIDVTG